MLKISVDAAAASPVYRQIVEQVRSLVATGAMAPGYPMPTVRALAQELGVSRLTVHKAYQELQKIGIVESRSRRGTVVVPIAEEDAGIDRLMSFVTKGPFAEFERICERMNVRSMASPVPDPRLFDVDQYLACTQVLREDKSWSFYFPDEIADHRLGRAFVAFARPYGLQFRANSVVPVSGVNPALTLLLPLFAPEGSTIAIQEPHSLNAAVRYHRHGYRAVGVPTASDGIDTRALEQACQKEEPKAFVAAPNFGFGDGVRWSRTNRKRAAEILTRYGVKLIERTSMSVLAFDDDQPPLLSSLMPADLCASEFSLQFCVAPGLHMSFVSVSPAGRLGLMRAVFRQGHALAKPQRLVLTEYFESGSLQSNLVRIVREYRRRREALCEVLSASLPEECNFALPSGGFCVHVKTQEPVDGEELFRRALKSKTAVMPCRYLNSAGTGDGGVVLSYSMLGPAALQEAGSAFCRVLKSML
ncbi:MAG TPA: PLP-dependent aminotransferase family protein [Fimbriimonadaceae bacterium]|nr:PLP-dependent aminotransferase family protein [Fimbriimonadaceae bacterium]